MSAEKPRTLWVVECPACGEAYVCERVKRLATIALRGCANWGCEAQMVVTKYIEAQKAKRRAKR